MDLFLIAAVILMVLGIIGSLYPAIPGPILSITGIVLYWWSTGYQEPGNIIFSVIILTGLLALGLDYLASYIGVESSDASSKTAFMAAIASLLLFPFTGPLGIIIGTAAVVLLREIMLGKEFDEAIRSAAYTTVALLASVFMKVCLTLLMLILFLISLLI